MGLFDNIIGTASEDIEPLGMEAITDDSKAESGSGTGTGGSGSGTGTGGSGTGTGGSGSGTGTGGSGSGTGTGGSGTGTGGSGSGTGTGGSGSGTGTGGSGSGTGNNIDTMINIGDLSSSNTPNIATNSGSDDIPNIDIGGDMDFSSLGINTEETNKTNEVVLMTDTIIETPKVEINNEITINAAIVDTTSSIPNIDINVDMPESKTIADTADTTNTLIPIETTPTFSLLDNSAIDTTPVTITEPIVEVTTLTTTSLIDIVPESAKEESIMAPIPETIPTVETTPTNNISPLSSLNLGHQKNTQDNTNHEPLSVRIAAFLKELEELKSNDEVTRAKLEQELVQIREDEKKINDAINLLNNIKNI